LLYELVLLALKEVEVLSSSAEYLRFEADVEEDTTEDGRSGVVGGGIASSSLVSGSSGGTDCGGGIDASPGALLLGPLEEAAFAIAPYVCCEGRKACVPLTTLGIIACIRSK